MFTRSFTLAVLAILVATSLMAACAPQSNLPALSLAQETERQVGAAVTTLGTAFVPNPGLGDPAILFRTLGAGGPFYFGLREVLLPLPSQARAAPLARALAGSKDDAPPGAQPASEAPTMLRLRFEGASESVQVVGADRLTGVVNYLVGSDPAQWHTAIPTYGQLVYKGLYPGIDLAYTGTSGALKGTFIVAPGADPGLVRWRYEGAAVRLRQGEVHIIAPDGGDEAFLVERRPEAWQMIAGRRVPVTVRYREDRDGTYGFRVGRYDPSQPLIIDPTLDYGTYWGFAGCEGAYHVAVDGANKVYLVGASNVANYPSKTTDCGDTDHYDIFVTKLDPAKTGADQRIYTTYLAGNKLDLGIAIRVDAAGNAYVGGYSWSSNFPTTANAYQRAFGGVADAIAAKLDPQGAAVYATYLGGSGFDEGYCLTAANGLMYLVGVTSSGNFPTTANAFRRTNQSGEGFVAVLDPSKAGAASLTYATFYGGANSEEITAVAVAGGLIYFAGDTLSTNLPLKNAIYATAPSAPVNLDAFAAVLDPSRTGADQLLFGTYLGGSAGEMPGGVAVDTAGRMYITGLTASANFPKTTGPASGGNWEGFLTVLNPNPPTALVWSRFVGGSGRDGLRDILLAPNGTVLVAGGTGSNNLPTVNPIQSNCRGGTAQAPYDWLQSTGDAVVAAFDGSGAMTFGTYLGGTGFDTAMGIALGTDGKVYVAGGTYSTNFATANPHQAANAGKYDAFVAAISGLDLGPVPRLVLPIVLRG